MVLVVGVVAGGLGEPDIEAVTGVPSCDEFLTQYEACIASKVMPEAKVEMAIAYVQLKASLKAMADDPQSKPASLKRRAAFVRQR
ncbi:MAG: hypothetical protein HC841_09760 [Verrucomicrobiae bacterium]|nr:hypothetical protein [Verrucomicrobiae bacterium]